jgi:predicted protein tyrosine phosphatase
MLPDFSICGAAELPEYLPWATHLVSIWSPGSRKELPFFPLPEGQILRVDFDDIENKQGQHPHSAHSLTPPSSQDLAGIIAFGKKLPHDARLLLHCQAGISRSTAAAFTILCAREPEISARRLLIKVWRKRPHCWPNQLMVDYADELLQRQGEMKEALQWFRPLQEQRLISWSKKTFAEKGI